MSECIKFSSLDRAFFLLLLLHSYCLILRKNVVIFVLFLHGLGASVISRFPIAIKNTQVFDLGIKITLMLSIP